MFTLKAFNDFCWTEKNKREIERRCLLGFFFVFVFLS